MIKLDVLMFLLGLVFVALGAALIWSAAGAFLFVAGCLLLILAPVVTVADRRHNRKG